MTAANEQTAEAPQGSSNMASVHSIPLAVCGIGLRLPGGIRNTRDYWDLLVNGKDARGPVPDSRFNFNGFNDSLGAKDAIQSATGYFLDEDLACFDTSFFSMTRKETEVCDPQQRQLLEVTREALDDAGELTYRGKDVGCYVGTFGDSWADIGLDEGQYSGAYILAGRDALMLSNRVSYEFDLKGPSMTIKTGCSASLVALHEACRGMERGDASAAVVAGTSLILSPNGVATFTSAGVLSPDASCKTFDASADGYARGEAITAVFIKPLLSALRDGNPVRAVIRATGVNNDGKSHGLFNPNSLAQEALIRKVYNDAHLNPSDTAFVECHGTGTVTGDVTEAIAVGNVFGESGIYIGSVKPNIGHGEGSSGLNSLIKAVLALEHHTIPPNIKFAEPNPNIPFAEKQLRVPVVPIAFPKDRAERVSVNSFGIGGTNAHAIVDSYSNFVPSVVTGHTHTSQPQLLLFSANTSSSLSKLTENYSCFMTSNPDLNSADVAFTLATRRERLPYRGYSIFQNGAIIETLQGTQMSTNSTNLYFIFSGQGAQWAAMGKDIIAADSLFKADMVAMETVLQGLTDGPAWSLTGELICGMSLHHPNDTPEELLRPAGDSRMEQPELSQPICTALQIALVNKFERHGVKPDGIVGHSSGEIAAAYTAGAISMNDAMKIAYYRGLVMKQKTQDGTMAAIGLGRQDVSKYLRDGVIVGCENSPTSTTLSGDREILLEVVSTIQQQVPDVLARLLKVDVAYHSHQMDDCSRAYMMLLERELKGYKKSDSEATGPFFSSLTGKIEEHSIISRPEYWVQNLTSPVLFFAAVESLLNTKGSGMLLEIGPHSTLAGPLREICAHVSQKYCYTSSLVRGEDSSKNVISVFGRLHVEGISTDFSSLYPNAKVAKDLLTYPWDHSNSFWSEGRASRLWRQRKFPHHCLLGSRIPESPDNAPQWRNVLSLENELWIADHEVARSVVLPFSGYIAMAGEAVRQLTGIETGYSIRHAVAHAALVLPELSSIEVITSLRPHRLTDFVDSEWFCFTISTYNSGSWTRNCEGQVKPISHTTSRSRQPQNYPRKVTSSTLYDYIADLGITFGREFQRLQRITSSTEEPIASAQVTPVTNEQRRPFLLHPVEIDACFQLLIVAQAKGLRRAMKSLSIPTVIETLDIFAAGEGEQHAVAWGPSGTIDNGVQCYCNGKLILSLSELRLSPLDASDLPGGDIHAAARLEWLPDMNFLDPVLLITPPKSDRRLYRLMEDMGHLCIVDTHEQIQSLEHLQPHFEKLRRWMMKVLQGRIHRSDALVSKITAYRDLTRDERQKLIRSRYKSLLDTSMHYVATATKRMWENYGRIFTGEAQPIDILMQDDVLSALYRGLSFDYGRYVRMMAVIKPTLRILEIGAGTGGTTEHILQHKTHQGGLPQFSKYTFTDVSAGFFAQAKERFENVPNMAYEVLDVTSDPILQGFERSSYDLIIAANVIHATPSLHRSLQHLNKLLKPGGTLLLMEACTESLNFGYVFGSFPGWWVGEADGRIDQPSVPPSRWNEELLVSGFTGAATVIYDEEVPYVRSVTIISQSASTVAIRSMVSLVVSDYEDPIVLELFEVLKRDGFTVTMQRLGDEIPANHDVLVLVDLKGPFFDEVSEESFTDFQKFVKHLDNRQNILWVTAPTQLKCKNPRFAQAVGVARALRAELNLRFHTLEIDENEAAYTGLILKVFRKICQEQDDEGLMSDKEFAVDAGTICVSRFQPFSLQDELSANSIAQKRTAKTLRIGEFGMIDSLYWIEEALPESLAPNEVEFEPKFIGLNLRDVLIAMGIIKSGGTVPFGVGFECSAVITAIGTEVKDLAIGDHIIAVAPDGLIATKKTLAENLIFRAPKQLSLKEAAAVPLVFLTAWYCLLNLGRLDKGKSVLIHSACGGVGLAAIQICKLVGAHIYATVGTEDKVTLLMDKFEIPRNRIFNSRNDSFLEGVMRETNNRGVDVVLNSLSGNLLHVSWDCVAKFGTMVEIGMRDLFDSGRLSLRRFDGSRQYSAFNGDLFGRERPDEMALLAKEFLPLFDVRTLEPLPYMTCFDAQHIVDAFRYLQSGKHVGKVLVSVPDDQAKIAATPSKKSIVFDPNATYLLTGGLGGLGKPIATWMIENGARSLTFLSRSAGTSERSRAAIQEFESMGCRVTAISGAVENMNDIKAAINNSPTPIKGVLHLAMVLRDATMLNMTWQQWTEVVRTKVLGAWNLHYALTDQSIEFLWLASSMNTVADLPGQGNYGASNAFLEAFCQYRLSLGLPTAVLSICPIKHIGYVAENMPTIHKATAHLGYALGENDFLDFVELSLLAAKTDREAGNTLPEIASIPLRPWKNTSQIYMGLRSKLRLGDPRNTVSWRLDRRMGFYHNLQDCDNDDKVGDNSELRDFLKRATEDTTNLAEDQNIEFLARTIGQRVLELTLKQGTSVDTTLTLAQMGVDSLMATELRRWFRQALGLQVNILELMKPLTLLDLAEVVSEQLQAKFAPATETAVQP